MTERPEEPPPEADFRETLRWMAILLAAILVLALVFGWLLKR